MANKGVIYYKLDSKYDGDITKYCGLSGGEIDSNFFFLRGNDIETINWANDGRELIFNKVNGEKIVVTGIDAKISVDGSYYDKSRGVLVLNVNGVEYEVSGFTLDNFTVYSGSKLSGDGTIDNPINVSETIETGFYAPAKSFLDLTNDSNYLPSNSIVGDRFLTKELISDYGLLYNFSAVQEINEILKNESSRWRVPTKDEWGEMLNALELCEDDMNHLSNLSNKYCGKLAGAYLKKSDEWVDSDLSTKQSALTKSYEFNALPTGVADFTDNGMVRNFGRMTGFWSINQDDETDAWTRLLYYNSDMVRQQGESTDGFFSLRLVRDYVDSVSNVEIIHNLPYETVLMPYVKLNEGGEIVETGRKVWTKQNVSFNSLLHSKEGKGASAIVVRNENGDIVGSSEKYFLNYWNGDMWEKREFPNNAMITLSVGPDGSMNEEWQLIDGELFKRSSVIIDTLKEYTDNRASEIIEKLISVDSKLDNEISERKTNEEVITNNINEINEKYAQIELKLAEEINRSNEFDESISNALESEITSRENNDAYINDKITDEIENRIAEDESIRRGMNELSSSLDEEIKVREANDIVFPLSGELVVSVVDGSVITTLGNSELGIDAKMLNLKIDANFGELE